jgi:hypothetical protein
VRLDRILHLLKLIPRDASYITIVPGGDSRFGDNPDVNLWAKVRNDISFCYWFVESFCELGQALPNEVGETHLWRLFDFKYHRNWQDIQALEAYVLTHPKMVVYRTIIECFLLHPAVEFEWISMATGISVEIIKLYHDWFFNVRDRIPGRNDAFILSLVFPESRQVEFTYNYHLTEDWTHIAKRIAYNKGLMPMLKWLGGRPSESEVAGMESMRALESGIASSGRFAIECGFQHQNNIAAIHSARQLLQSSKLGGQNQQDDDQAMGLGRISSDAGAQLVIKQITERAARSKLKAAQIYDTSIAEQLQKSRDKLEKDTSGSV